MTNPQTTMTNTPNTDKDLDGINEGGTCKRCGKRAFNAFEAIARIGNEPADMCGCCPCGCDTSIYADDYAELHGAKPDQT